jgi:hypothetical protein
MSLIPASKCANQYTCPGGGSGYGIQFNIVQFDVDNLTIPSAPDFDPAIQGITIAAATSAFNKTSLVPWLPLTYWYNTMILKYKGIAGPTPMTCTQRGPDGFAVGLAQVIVGAFGVSPSRICNAVMKPTIAPNDIDILSIKFTFYITDLHPAIGVAPLDNDYLPAACVGSWIMSWLTKATLVLDPSNPQQQPPITQSLPLAFQSPQCPGFAPPSPTAVLYFTSEVSSNNDKLVYIEKLKKSFGSIFGQKSFLRPIFDSNSIENLTNISASSVQLHGSGTSIFSPPQTILDLLVMYSYPLSFIGAILFTIIQIIDINPNTLIANKNISIAINISFVIWSVVSMCVYYNIPIYNIPLLGDILQLKIPFVFPLNTQAVITQA